MASSRRQTIIWHNNGLAYLRIFVLRTIEKLSLFSAVFLSDSDLPSYIRD